MEPKPTLVLGASPNPDRYSYKAITMLTEKGHPVFAIGSRPGFVGSTEIKCSAKVDSPIHTITIYLRAELQKSYYNFILELKPQRIIFNPGTENPELEDIAKKHGIATTQACTLVLLATGNY